ncbi:MAG: multicopper oxidase domain-containing protein [Cyclobacteriaceae bacterium]|nr:multicopper oxidase domain-containing protein [Cyclobacteriaceae bacterium]
MKFSLLTILIVTAQILYGQSPLLIPSTISGSTIELNLQNGTYEFYNGKVTTTMGANGDILGPTLLLNQGDFVNFTINNQLSETTTIHWHGLHVSAENDGGPHTTIAAGAAWNPSFTILDKAATYWYHPHLHEKTNEHVSKGIAGLIIITDDEEAALALPRTYGVDDFPMVMQTKDFDANYQIVAPSNADDVAMVNATIDPYLDAPAQVIRIRLLNGSSQRVFNVGLSNDQAFYQIASDGGLLATPNQTTRLLLSPGERAEILVNFTGEEGSTVYLKSYASELPNGIYGATNPGNNASMTLDGYNPNPLNGADFNLLQFNVVAQTASPITSIPTTLAVVTPIEESTSNKTRTLTFSPATMGMDQLNGDFLINDVSFDMDVINISVPFENVEIWELTNQSAIAHPFHIHDVQFYVLSRNGNTPPASEQGRKDVVFVKPQETVRFITVFETFTDSPVPYMYHCHLLTHEDRGMMGQFTVNTPLAVADNYLLHTANIYPNPTTGTINLNLEEQIDPNNIKIYDQTGKELKQFGLKFLNGQVQIYGLPKGLFVLKIQTKDVFISKKIIVE